VDALWLGEQMVLFEGVMETDERLRAQHVALYVAILWMGAKGVPGRSVKVTRAELMMAARVSSKATYHRVIRDLERFGYIRYQPSFNSFVGTTVVLLLVA